MARPSFSDKLSRDVGNIRRSQKWRKEDERDALWERMVNLYRGKHYQKESQEDRMLVNLAFATKNVIAPSVAVNNPKFTVNARKPDAADQAVITEEVLNYLWRVHSYQDEFRLCVDDFLVIGHGWIKVGYHDSKPKELKTVPDYQNGNEDDEEGVDDREPTPGNVETELRNFDDEDRPFIERISPYDMFVDSDSRHPKEMKWIAQRTRRPILDVMVDSRYDATIRKKVRSAVQGQRSDDEARSLTSGRVEGAPEQTHDHNYVDVWEFYDIRKGTVATFCAEQTDGYLIKPQEMPYAFGHPFVMLRNYEVMDTFYPMGELEAIEELQYELNATRTQMMNHRKRYQRKVLYDKEAFEQDGIDALLDDKDNVLVPVDTVSAQVPIDKVVAPMPQMGTPPDFYNQSDLIQSDIDRVSGVSDYMRGAQAEIRRTATEAAMIQDAMNARAADKLSRVESALSLIGSRVVQLMQQYLSEEHVIRVIGMNSQPMWMKFDADYIKGEFDYEIEGGSTQPRNESFRRQSAMQMIEAMAPFVGQGVINPMALARHVLQFGFDIKAPEHFFGQPGMAPGGPEQGGPPQGQPPQQEGAPEEGAPQTIGGIPNQLSHQLMGQQGLPPDVS